MGEQQKKELDEWMAKEVRNQTYALVNEGAVIFVFSNNFVAGLQGYYMHDDGADHGYIKRLVGVWNTWHRSTVFDYRYMRTKSRGYIIVAGSVDEVLKDWKKRKKNPIQRDLD